jgi:hypothetical protein
MNPLRSIPLVMLAMLAVSATAAEQTDCGLATLRDLDVHPPSTTGKCHHRPAASKRPTRRVRLFAAVGTTEQDLSSNRGIQRRRLPGGVTGRRFLALQPRTVRGERFNPRVQSGWKASAHASGRQAVQNVNRAGNSRAPNCAILVAVTGTRARRNHPRLARVQTVEAPV